MSYGTGGYCGGRPEGQRQGVREQRPAINPPEAPKGNAAAAGKSDLSIDFYLEMGYNNSVF